MWIYIVLGILGAALIAEIVYLCIASTKSYKTKQKIKKIGKYVDKLEQIARTKLVDAGFNNVKDYSTAGYEFVECKTEHNYPDNVHLVFDYDIQKIAYYSYFPLEIDPEIAYKDLYFFDLYEFKDLVAVTVESNLGVHYKYDLEEGKFEAGSEIFKPVEDDSGSIAAITATLSFKDGKTAGVNFLNNIPCEYDSDEYKNAMSSAKLLFEECIDIIDEMNGKNSIQETQADGRTRLRKLIEVRKLVIKGLATEEDYENAKRFF